MSAPHELKLPGQQGSAISEETQNRQARLYTFLTCSGLGGETRENLYHEVIGKVDTTLGALGSEQKLFSMALHRVRQHQRRLRVRELVFENEAEKQRNKSLSASFRAEDYDRVLADNIFALPDEHREVLLLVDVVGLPLADVGSMLKVEFATTMSRLGNARLALSKAMAKVPDEVSS